MLIPLLFACAPEEEEEDAPEDTAPVEEEEGISCAENTLRIDGEEAPAVGDSWTVYMLCDGNIMTGAAVMRFDPTDFATIEENTATFLYAGDATMTFQMGQTRLTEDVTVTE
jgi:hypothetical protein